MEAAKNDPSRNTLAVVRKVLLRTRDANRMRRVLAITRIIAVATAATITAAMRAVSRWADIIKKRVTAMVVPNRRSRVRAQWIIRSKKTGTSVKKNARVGTSHRSPTTNRGAMLKVVATRRAS